MKQRLHSSETCMDSVVLNQLSINRCVKLLHAFIMQFSHTIVHSSLAFIYFCCVFQTVRIMIRLLEALITQSQLRIRIIQIHAPRMCYQTVFVVELYKV